MVVVTVRSAFGAGTRYRVAARGFRNLRGLTGGGDTTFVWEPPADTVAPSDTIPPPPPDTAAAHRDTGAARVDTTSAGTRAPPRDPDGS